MQTMVAETGVAIRGNVETSRLTLRVAPSIAEAASFWDALTKTGAGSAYQSRRFLEPWIDNVAPTLGIAPRLGLVRNEAGAPVALLPFGTLRRGPLQAVVYLGGRDSNLNMPLVARGAIITPEAARTLLRDFAGALSQRADVFILANNVCRWNGEANPLAFDDAVPSPSNALAATIGTDAESFLTTHDSRDARKKLRSKAAKLASLGDVIFTQAPASETASLIQTMLAQKRQLLAARGIAAGLDGAHVAGFLSALSVHPADAPALDVYVLRVGDAIAAVFGGLRDGAHWHGLINSYSSDPAIARCSPGDLLLRYVIRDLSPRGVTSFDLGIGEARYKAALCDETIELVDTLFPVTPLGRLYASAERLRLIAKRRIKQTPWAIEATRRAQRLFARQ